MTVFVFNTMHDLLSILFHLILVSCYSSEELIFLNKYAGTSLVMTVMRSISNDHGHIARVGAWCWTESGRTAKASILQSWIQAIWYLYLVALFA